MRSRATVAGAVSAHTASGETAEQRLVRVRFTPQAWINDNTVEVDPQGPLTFEVPVADATDAAGNWLPDNDYASDQLREHPNAPDWIRRWSGPFEIAIEHDDAAT
jgi:hypothetical protein